MIAADRDWLTRDNTAYVLKSTMRPGVGSYLTAFKVTIKSVGVRDVRVIDDSGQTSRFRTSDLKAPRTGGRWTSDDILVPATDPRVRRALAAARAAIISSRSWSKLMELTKGIEQSKVKHYDDPDASVADTLAALAEIRDAATDAHTRLMRIRETS